ncbi:ATP-binding protein [Streptantibioticus ferralitis]|uniref:ATP-binding protein n=1 Tax=Streptantibioticus ferralitis TaxID=236510 RepID=A0ABT5Z0F8_9ACTN|nr:ATP-binding protein [Streptantibioticus ferralitis]MDF2257318.1 ATP-binding protein [Streptantibioticus ferralitis]
MTDQSERRFNRAPASVGAVRAFVLAALPTEQARHRIDDIALCVSELATNAVEHGTPAGHLFLVRVIVDDALLRIEVHDAGDGRPRLQLPADEDLSGRGLCLVDALADGWGTMPRDGLGKVVWAEFKLRACAPMTRTVPC